MKIKVTFDFAFYDQHSDDIQLADLRQWVEKQLNKYKSESIRNYYSEFIQKIDEFNAQR